MINISVVFRKLIFFPRPDALPAVGCPAQLADLPEDFEQTLADIRAATVALGTNVDQAVRDQRYRDLRRRVNKLRDAAIRAETQVVSWSRYCLIPRDAKALAKSIGVDLVSMQAEVLVNIGIFLALRGMTVPGTACPSDALLTDRHAKALFRSYNQIALSSGKFWAMVGLTRHITGAWGKNSGQYTKDRPEFGKRKNCIKKDNNRYVLVKNDCIWGR